MNTYIENLVNRHASGSEKVSPPTRYRFENVGVNKESLINSFQEEETQQLEEQIQDRSLEKKSTKDKNNNHPTINIQEVQKQIENTLITNTTYKDNTIKQEYLNKETISNPFKESEFNPVYEEQFNSSDSFFSDKKTNSGQSVINPRLKKWKDQAAASIMNENSFSTQQIHPENIKENLQTSVPTIQVNIGRIEVQGTPTPKKSLTRKQKSIRKPNMSLDDYLKKRK